MTDITYIRTWLGWSMKPTLSRELAPDALMMAVWRRRPSSEVIVHSDQGSQYGSDDWQRFCRANNLAPSMSRRSNCWDTQFEHQPNLIHAGIGEHNAFALTCRLDADVSLALLGPASVT